MLGSTASGTIVCGATRSEGHPDAGGAAGSDGRADLRAGRVMHGCYAQESEVRLVRRGDLGPTIHGIASQHGPAVLLRRSDRHVNSSP